MKQPNTPETPGRVAPACVNAGCSTCRPSVADVLERRRTQLKTEDRLWEAQMNEFVYSAGQTDIRRINLQAEDEYAIQELNYAEARANPHRYGFSVREQMLAPNPNTVTSGDNEVELDDSWFTDERGVDIRILQGRDLRYWLLWYMDRRSRSSHRIADLATAITAAGFRVVGRASKTISDAMHTETDRGRITRTGWGRYQITQPLASSSRRRVIRRIEERRRILTRTLARAGDRLETLWRRTLENSNHRVWCRTLPSLIGHHTDSTIRIFCTKVASPTDKTESSSPCMGVEARQLGIDRRSSFRFRMSSF